MTLSRRSVFILFGALALSLCANLFFAGFHLMPWKHGPYDRIDRLAAIAAVSNVPPEVDDILRAELEKERPQIRETFRAMRDSRRAARDAMRADPFDPAALDRAYIEMRARSDAFQTLVHATAARAIAQAPAAARAEIQDRRGGD